MKGLSSHLKAIRMYNLARVLLGYHPGRARCWAEPGEARPVRPSSRCSAPSAPVSSKMLCDLYIDLGVALNECARRMEE